jgi:hypothetical protein
MAIEFQSAYSRSTTRVRVVFSNTLGSGAYSTSFFSLAVVDGYAVAPPIVEALLVPGRGQDIELALGGELTEGARYLLTISAGVPDVLSDTAAGATARLTIPQTQLAANEEQTDTAILDELFQRDLLHDGTDFIEDANGDIAQLVGLDNARSAVARRVAADGLKWDQNFGPALREHVDEHPSALYAMRSKIGANLRQDDRIADADVRVSDADIGDDGTVVLPVDITFVGNLTDSVETKLVQ